MQLRLLIRNNTNNDMSELNHHVIDYGDGDIGSFDIINGHNNNKNTVTVHCRCHIIQPCRITDE